MTRTLLLLAALAAAQPATAATRSYSVTQFDRIRVDGPFAVTLTTNVAPFARASGSPAGLDGISVSVEGRTLVVRPNRSSWGGYPGQARGPVTLEVGTRDLGTAIVNGSGSLAIDRVRGLAFDLTIQGSGTASVGDAQADRLNLGIAGSGSARIAGRALALKAIVRGSSSLDASGLAAKDVVIGAEGPTVVQVNASNSARVDASGLASVTLTGRPSCTVKALGSSSVSGCR